MTDSSSLQDCLNAVYRYLSYRPRSEGEIRQWLRRRGFAGETTETVMARLREQNLSDDFAFARFWKDNRLSFRPKSKRLIEKELRDKKVATEIIEQVTEGIDDEQIAYELGSRRMHSLARLEYRDFYRRLASYLAYRGFGYEVIKRTAALLWRERECH
ncbi:MAG: RecX family transcriptional regulator [Dehalococcoidia bacterium]|nr:MAG: RecX family transcriptional regulator [Dehalococcoidia bacterium]